MWGNQDRQPFIAGRGKLTGLVGGQLNRRALIGSCIGEVAGTNSRWAEHELRDDVVVYSMRFMLFREPAGNGLATSQIRFVWMIQNMKLAGANRARGPTEVICRTRSRCGGTDIEWCRIAEQRTPPCSFPSLIFFSSTKKKRLKEIVVKSYLSLSEQRHFPTLQRCSFPPFAPQSFLHKWLWSPLPQSACSEPPAPSSRSGRVLEKRWTTEFLGP